MCMFQIKKVDQFPPFFNDKDTILAEGKHLEEIPFRLAEIGFKDCKIQVIDGVKVYVKGKTNMVYVKYIHSIN